VTEAEIQALRAELEALRKERAAVQRSMFGWVYGLDLIKAYLKEAEAVAEADAAAEEKKE